MKIKVCGMRDASNLNDVARLGTDMTGFIFYKGSPRYVKQGDALGNFHEFEVELDPPPLRVGVFVNASEEEVLEETAAHRLDYVQLHGDESPGYCASIQGFVPVIKAFRVGPDFDLGGCEAYQQACDLFLFDAKGLRYGGNGTKFDWGILADYQGPTPFLLSGGIGPEDVEAIAAFEHPFLEGIDLNSGFELSPGDKNVASLRGFVNRIRSMHEKLSAI